MTFLTLTIPAHSHVLLLEDSDMRIAWFEKRIKNLKVTRTVQEFKDYFNTKPLVDFVLMDHDLGTPETGLDAAKFMVDRFGATNNWGLIHSWNKAGAEAMQACGLRLLHVPFGEFEIKEGD